MKCRPAVNSDLDKIMEIIADAQLFLKQNGVDQWQDGYPGRQIFEDDINTGSCYVCVDEGRVVGVFSVFTEEEIGYDLIEDGDWLTGGVTYGVIHRTALDGAYRGRGLASRMLAFAENLVRERGISSMRGDTHRSNKTMSGLFEKCGYVRCGSVHIQCAPENDSHRVAYEKLLND